jgi:hypothetical protein
LRKRSIREFSPIWRAKHDLSGCTQHAKGYLLTFDKLERRLTIWLRG